MDNLFIDIENKVKTYTKQFVKGDIIYSEGEKNRTVGIIKSGEVVILTYTIDGFSYEIENLKIGQIFGDSLIFENSSLPGTIVAKENSKIIFIDQADFIKLLENDHLFLRNYLTMTSLRYSYAKYRTKLLGQPSIREKILFYLKEEIKRQKSKTIELKMTKEELAQFLSLNRPSLSRELIRMKSDGLINYSRKTITYLK